MPLFRFTMPGRYWFLVAGFCTLGSAMIFLVKVFEEYHELAGTIVMFLVLTLLSLMSIVIGLILSNNPRVTYRRDG